MSSVSLLSITLLWDKYFVCPCLTPFWQNTVHDLGYGHCDKNISTEHAAAEKTHLLSAFSVDHFTRKY